MCCGVFPSFSFSARAVVGVGKVGAIMVGSSNSSSSASEVFVHEPSLEQHWLSLQFLKNPEIENSHRRWILGRVRPALMACSVLYAASNGVVYVLPTPSNPVTDPLLAQVVAAQIVFAILSASLIGGAWMFGGLTTTALRATEFGILCIMVGDGYGQAVLAAVQGLPFPLALVGIACGNALTGLPWSVSRDCCVKDEERQSFLRCRCCAFLHLSLVAEIAGLIVMEDGCPATRFLLVLRLI